MEFSVSVQFILFLWINVKQATWTKLTQIAEYNVSHKIDSMQNCEQNDERFPPSKDMAIVKWDYVYDLREIYQVEVAPKLSTCQGLPHVVDGQKITHTEQA